MKSWSVPVRLVSPDGFTAELDYFSSLFFFDDFIVVTIVAKKKLQIDKLETRKNLRISCVTWGQLFVVKNFCNYVTDVSKLGYLFRAEWDLPDNSFFPLNLVRTWFSLAGALIFQVIQMVTWQFGPVPGIVETSWHNVHHAYDHRASVCT